MRGGCSLIEGSGALSRVCLCRGGQAGRLWKALSHMRLGCATALCGFSDQLTIGWMYRNPDREQMAEPESDGFTGDNNTVAATASFRTECWIVSLSRDRQRKHRVRLILHVWNSCSLYVTGPFLREEPSQDQSKQFSMEKIVSPFIPPSLCFWRTPDALGGRLDPVPWAGSWMRSLWQRIYKTDSLRSFSTGSNQHTLLVSQHSGKVWFSFKKGSSRI